MKISEKPVMVVKMFGVELYRGSVSPISVEIDDKDLLRFSPVAGMLTEDTICAIVEQGVKAGAIRIHPRAIKEF